MSEGPSAPDDASERSLVCPVSPGDILAGKYRVDRVLGVGGMGVVVAATHIDLLEPRAIKFMLPKHLGDAEAVHRFVNEARACARLKGEHITKVHDVGTLASGAPYMIMEYLTGLDLGRELERRGPIPASEAALHVLQACEALAEAHAAGIVHRDLKPENLFLADLPGGVRSIKVLDFGISVVMGNELRLTNATAIMGSPYYMSPEQARSARSVDARTDIWSLGVVLYQLLTGRLPFEGLTLTEVITAVLFSSFHPPSALVPGLPAGIDRVVLRCLERDLDRRYGSVTELATDLAPFITGSSAGPVERISRMLPVRSLGLHVEDSVSGISAAWRNSQPEVPPPAKPGSTPYLGFAIGLALAVALGGVAFLVHRSSTPRDVEITAPALTGPAASPSPTVTVTPSAETTAPVANASASAGPTVTVAAPLTSGHRPGPLRGPTTKSTATAAVKPTPPSGNPFGAGRQ